MFSVIAGEVIRRDTLGPGTGRAKFIPVRQVLAEGNVVVTLVRVDGTGRIELALTAVRKSADEYRGYVMNAREDALFTIARGTQAIELMTTAGDRGWSRAWRIRGVEKPVYRELKPAVAIPPDEFAELEALAQEFVARWIWFRNGPHEETSIEAQRFAALGYAIHDANLRSAALARIGSGAAAIRYSELGADGAWIEDAIARCWMEQGKDEGR